MFSPAILHDMKLNSKRKAMKSLGRRQTESG